ncbi:serine/threonine protein kinase [Oscillatoriales cyanobacterium USR001]|nr:serine/threonine protein kinase [Oscillatoriales cyanobacterium USR001]
MNLTSGTVLQKGKYRIDKVLGVGGFGVTYRATHIYLAQTVILKTLNDTLRQHPNFAKFQQQFIAQAHRFSWCQHPNIVRVLDFFEEAGLCFVVMEYIAGKSLATAIESGQRLSEMEALNYIRQIASALKTLHHSGLVHRNIKPENIIQRTGTNLVMLTDFGLTFDFPANMRQTYNGLLSAGYAAIEQYLPEIEEKKQDALAMPTAGFAGARSSRSGLGLAKNLYQLTPATDIYGLAATFYYLLTGEKPVAAPLRAQIPLFSLRQAQPLICPGIERAILWGLEMEAKHRPQTVENWLTFLDEQQLLERQKEEAESIELSLFPSSIFMLFLFFFTSGMSGWLGFDFTRRSITVATIDNGLTRDRSLMPKEYWQYPELGKQNPSKPLFSNPSVESDSTTLYREENKFPEANLNNSEAEKDSNSTTVTSSPSPTDVNQSPTPEVEKVQSDIPESASQEAKLYTPEPVFQEPQSYYSEPKAKLPSEEAIAPEPVKVPPVLPLPLEPIDPPTPAPVPSAARVEVSPFSESVPKSASIPEVEPLVPNFNDSSVESAVRSPSPSGIEPDVPFPEPSSN